MKNVPKRAPPRGGGGGHWITRTKIASGGDDGYGFLIVGGLFLRSRSHFLGAVDQRLHAIWGEEGAFQPPHPASPGLTNHGWPTKVRRADAGGLRGRSPPGEARGRMTNGKTDTK